MSHQSITHFAPCIMVSATVNVQTKNPEIVAEQAYSVSDFQPFGAGGVLNAGEIDILRSKIVESVCLPLNREDVRSWNRNQWPGRIDRFAARS